MDKFKPHPYQQEGIDFIMDKGSCALFFDMGLGKTVVCLKAIQKLFYEEAAIKGVLVVAPKRVMTLTWPLEIEKWDISQWVDYVIVHGKKKEQLLNTPAHIYLTNYESLTWLGEQLDQMDEWPFDLIIFDEITKMKSHNSIRFKKFRYKANKIPYKIGLTGTPMPKNLLDLWAQFRMLDDGKRLGTSFTLFRRKYFYQDDYHGFKFSTTPENEKIIHKLISDITLRISEGDVLDVPPMNVEDIELDMPKRARKDYKILEREMFVELESGDEVEVFNAAALSNKCMQFTGGAIYHPQEFTEEGKKIKRTWMRIHEVKMDALKEVYNREEAPLLVAYSFRHEMERILKEYPEAQHMSSHLSKKKERQLLDDWNNGEVQMLVCHPDSAGHGLNLQAGSNRALWFSMNWRLDLTMQLNKRLCRQGQTKPVTITRLIMQNTVDEVVATILENREENQESLFRALMRYKKIAT